jgi:hypothetical protein
LSDPERGTPSPGDHLGDVDLVERTLQPLDRARRRTTSRTDWQIIEESFKRYPERYQRFHRVPSAPPRVKERIYSVNGMLKNQAGERRLLIHPQCKDLLEDLEQVVWKTDPPG